MKVTGGIQWQSCEQNPNPSTKPVLCHNYHTSFRLKTVPSVYKSLYRKEKLSFFNMEVNFHLVIKHLHVAYLERVEVKSSNRTRMLLCLPNYRLAL